jgi:hypothetical protein
MRARGLLPEFAPQVMREAQAQQAQPRPSARATSATCGS